MRNLFFALAAAFFFVSFSARADYAWIPKYQNLNAKIGFDFVGTNENFSSDGDRADIRYATEQVRLNRFGFWAEPEYGFARDWSASLRFGFLSQSVDSEVRDSGSLLSSSGLQDLRLSTKWKLMQKNPTLTLEAILRVPTSPQTTTSTDELLLGDGIFDFGAILHAGHVMRPLYFALSPGFVLRSSDYSSQFLLGSAFGVMLKNTYFRLFTDLALSLNKTEPATVVTQNPKLGTGGSFAIGSLAPDNFIMGFKTGLTFYQKYKIEFSIAKSLFGRSAPNFLWLGLSLGTSFDFYRVEKKIQVKEVPFETEVLDPATEQ